MFTKTLSRHKIEFFLLPFVVLIFDRKLAKGDNDWSFFAKTSQFPFPFFHTWVVVVAAVVVVAMA